MTFIVPGAVMPYPRIQFFSNSGLPLGNGFLYTYAAGTSTPQPTYADVNLTVPNTNPIQLDPFGRATVYLSPLAYKFVLFDQNNVQVWAQDNVEDVGQVFAAALAAPTGAGDIGFLQSGSGAVARTLLDKVRETLSVTDFGAVGDGVTDDTAAVQNAVNAAAGGVCYFPAGTYILSSTIQLPSNIFLVGAGRASSILQSSAGTPAINLVTGWAVNDLAFEDLGFIGGGTAYPANPDTGNGIQLAGPLGTGLPGCARVAIHRCRFVACNNGVRDNNGVAINITECDGDQTTHATAFVNWNGTTQSLCCFNRPTTSLTGGSAPEYVFFVSDGVNKAEWNRIESNLMMGFNDPPIVAAATCTRSIIRNNLTGSTIWTGIKSISGAYALEQFVELLLVDTSGGDVTVSLPQAALRSQVAVCFKQAVASANTIIIAPAGSDDINGVNSNYVVPATSAPRFPAATLISDGVSNWTVVGVV